MPEEYAPLRSGIKRATLAGSPRESAPMPTGLYLTKHPSTHRPSEAGRKEYVESPQRLEREFQKGLERNRQRLAEQRERIKREAAVQRGLAGPAAAGTGTVQSRDRGRRR